MDFNGEPEITAELSDSGGLTRRIRVLLLAIALALAAGGIFSIRGELADDPTRVAIGEWAIVGLALVWVYRAWRPKVVWYDFSFDCLLLGLFTWSTDAPLTTLGVYYGAVVYRSAYRFKLSWLVRPLVYAVAYVTAIIVALQSRPLTLPMARIVPELAVITAVSLLVTTLFKATSDHDSATKFDQILKVMSAEIADSHDKAKILSSGAWAAAQVVSRDSEPSSGEIAVGWSEQGHCHLITAQGDPVSGELTCWKACRDRRALSSRSTHTCGIYANEFLEIAQSNGELREATESSLLVLPFRTGSDCGGAILVDRGSALGNRSLVALTTAAVYLRMAMKNALLVESLERSEERRNALLSKVVTATERERTLIASDLHDGPIQSLTAITFDVDFAQATLAAGDLTEAADTLVDLRHLLTDEVARLRSMMVDLVPPTLSERGLAIALRDFVRTIAERHPGISFDFSGDLHDRPDSSIEHTLYRLSQEAIANAIKHSGATSITVSVSQSEEFAVELVVADDGAGFDPDSIEDLIPTGHFGLASMEHRMEMVGGDLRIASGPEAGTRVTARIPVGDLAVVGR